MSSGVRASAADSSPKPRKDKYAFGMGAGQAFEIGRNSRGTRILSRRPKLTPTSPTSRRGRAACTARIPDPRKSSSAWHVPSLRRRARERRPVCRRHRGAGQQAPKARPSCQLAQSTQVRGRTLRKPTPRRRRNPGPQSPHERVFWQSRAIALRLSDLISTSECGRWPAHSGPAGMPGSAIVA